jgi:DNA invertase Pin-like site-specific DNA recombinase
MRVDEIAPQPTRVADRPGHGPIDEPPWARDKVRPRHLDRLAIVYVRQSTAQQVLEHRESAALQYDLRRRAVALGWAADRVIVIDEDRGLSGGTAEGRLGFQRLLAEIGLDHVGIVLGVEMSRLARSCKDWHQLLELCAIFQVLLADQDGLYDPGDYNDRLLLGLKGTMSEAELHILRGRMLAGRRNKARRGELFNHAPIGFVRLPGAMPAPDPDEQVRDVVRLLIDKFDELGTVSGLLRYLVHNRILLPVRPHFGPDRGQLEWRRPNRVTLTFLLHHPIYAGAYSHGRRPADPRRKVPGRPATGRRLVPMEQWEVLIRDRLPGYITWERYETNLRRLARNRARVAAMGAPRDGDSLLTELIFCGRCRRRMLVSYPGGLKRARYSCRRGAIEYAEPACQSLAGQGLDELVARLVLTVLEPASLELSLGAGEDLRRERGRLDRHWRQRLERARYEADRAARQHRAVEPENRLVGRELERRWEQALAAVREVEEEYDRFRRDQPAELTAGVRDADADFSVAGPLLVQTAQRRRRTPSTRGSARRSAAPRSRKSRPRGLTAKNEGGSGGPAGPPTSDRLGGRDSHRWSPHPPRKRPLSMARAAPARPTASPTMAPGGPATSPARITDRERAPEGPAGQNPFAIFAKIAVRGPGGDFCEYCEAIGHLRGPKCRDDPRGQPRGRGADGRVAGVRRGADPARHRRGDDDGPHSSRPGPPGRTHPPFHTVPGNHSQEARRLG